MRGWIFNASPVILLGKIRQLHLIEALSPAFRIPRAVVDEIGAAVVLDDLAARKFALSFQLPLLGTLGLLVRAKKAGLVDRVAPHIQSLESAGANLSEAVVASALAQANETP